MIQRRETHGDHRWKTAQGVARSHVRDTWIKTSAGLETPDAGGAETPARDRASKFLAHIPLILERNDGPNRRHIRWLDSRHSVALLEV
jgi:hypothetical protein